MQRPCGQALKKNKKQKQPSDRFTLMGFYLMLKWLMNKTWRNGKDTYIPFKLEVTFCEAHALWECIILGHIWLIAFMQECGFDHV